MKIPLLVLLILLSLWGFAQENKSDDPAEKFVVCKAQIKNFCADEVTSRGAYKCLYKKAGQLPQECQQELERLKMLYDQTSEEKGGSINTFYSLNSPTPPLTIISYDGNYVAGSPSLNEDRVKFSTPILQTKEDYLAISAVGGREHLGSPVLMNSTLAIPTDLYRTELGAQYSHQLPGFRNWGLRGAVGYAGDDLSSTLQDTTFNLSAMYGYPINAGDFLTWSIYISNDVGFAGPYVPIPGIAYLHRTPTFTGIFGFPLLSLQWTPQKQWAYSFSAVGLAMTAEAKYGGLETAQYFTALSWSNQKFVLSQRLSNLDRLTIEDKKASIGVRTYLFGRMQAELQTGYSFDRIIYSGNGVRNMNDGSATLTPGMFILASLKAGY